MDDLALDHLYRETGYWDESVSWWMKLGLVFEDEWGEEPHRAGKLVRDGLVVVLAEVMTTSPTQAIFIATQDIDAVANQIGTPVAHTHWGTRMVTVTDPDGRTYNFEPGSSDS
jgi:uncharacterized glyoxalase superfamily protein PhnB